MVRAGEEITVVSDIHGEKHLDLTQRNQGQFPQLDIVAQDVTQACVQPQDLLQEFSDFVMHFAPKAGISVEGRLLENCRVKFQGRKHLRLLHRESLQVENIRADGHTNTRRRVAARLEDAIWEIGQGEFGVRVG